MKPSHTIAITLAFVAAILLCIIGPYLDYQKKKELVQKLKEHPEQFEVYGVVEDMNGRTDIIAEDDKFKIIYWQDKNKESLTVTKKP
ncbi:MAG: hypothetical protein V4469_00200 [Patescibacteria group bacterium]